MSQNKNFTLNLPGAETEITLPIEKVEELMKVMNMMDKKGFSEEETRRIVIEEFCKFKQKIEEENQIRGRNQQSGDGTSVRYGPSAKVKSLPSVVVSKKSVMPTARRTSSKVVLEDIEVKKMCESSRYPIYVTADDIVTIYPSYMVERFLKTAQLSKKKTKYTDEEENSLTWWLFCILALGLGTVYFIKTNKIHLTPAIESPFVPPSQF